MDPDYKVRILICCDCGEEFVFTADAQRYFAEKGYTHDPKRCKSCHLMTLKERRKTAKSCSHVDISAIHH